MSFEATLSDAFGKAHVMLIDDVEVSYVDNQPHSTLVQLANDAHMYTAKPADHKYEFVDGKAQFTDTDDVVRKVELFKLVPMVELKE